MRLINIETRKLEEFFGDVVPPYAILSHTWGVDDEEITFRDIQTGKGNIEKADNGRIKFEGCCKQAKKDELRYAWIDTCCVDKANAVELGEAINSMFRWYRRAACCYTFLLDVPPGDNSWDSGSKFFASRWFRRGWTLQELLAPEELRFYNQEWTFIGTKGDMSKEIETITGIPRQFLLGWEDFSEATVAQRMSWAANRATKRKEDIAYCLLGIFGVTMPMIYGEGDQAFSRLQEEIMKSTRDDSILAWGLDAAESIPSNSTDVVSAGILATAPSDFENCRRIVLRKQDTTAVNTFDVSGGRLRVHLPLHTTSVGEIFALLNCGPEHHTDQVVGIPLQKAVHGAAPDEYLRPQGHYPVFLSKTTSVDSAKPIRIQMGRQSRAQKATSRRYWLYISGHQKINVKLSDVHPQISWVKGRALVAEANEPAGNITRRYLARFRTRGEGSRDVVVVLEFEIQGLQAQARCHVMVSSRDTDLEDLAQKLIYMGGEAFGKHSASNGSLNLKVTVKEELFAQQPTFFVTLAQMSTPPEATVDATLELRQVNLKLEFVRILQEEDQIRQNKERLKQQRDETLAALTSMRKRLAVVEVDLSKWSAQKILLTREVDELTNRDHKVGQLQEELSGQESETQRRLHELDSKMTPKNWLERMIKMLLDVGKIDFDLKDMGNSDPDRPLLPSTGESGHNTNGQTPLSWAAANGRQAVLKKLLKERVDLECRESDSRTPLSLAAGNGHEAVVKLLLEKGADRESKDKDGRTPLSWATMNTHQTIVKMLAPEGTDSKTSVSPPKLESQATGSPTKLSVPHRKLRDKPVNRAHDIEFAAEISTSLLAQVRNLQTLLAEREEELRDSKAEYSQLDIEVEGLRRRVEALDESERRYMDENWNLETNIHELGAASKESAEREKKMAQSLNVLQAERISTQGGLEEIKVTHAALVDDHAAVVKHNDIEPGTAKGNMAMDCSERDAMHRKIEGLTSQNQELAKALSLQRGRALNRDAVSGLSDEEFETAADDPTPEHSPPLSPVKGTPRHSILESETLKSSLQHAQRTIQSLRTNIHRKKTEKLELKRLLQETRDELEKARGLRGTNRSM